VQILSLRSCNITGPATAINACASLSLVDLSYNMLTGGHRLRTSCFLAAP
jgi:hypothetical protein